MKFKYYLRGCGLGIIVTVLVMSIALHNRGGVMTDEKVIARAGELGMVMQADPDSSDGGNAYQNTQSMDGADGTESTADTEAAVDTEKTVETESEEQTGLSTESLEATRVSKVASALGASGAGKPVTESGTGTSSSEAAEKSNSGTSSSEAAEQSDAGTSSEAAEPSGTKKSKTVTVKVRQGDVCREVALKLQKNGLVSDADAFRDYMQNKGYDERISIGTFQFQKGMTYEEIADILIGKA